jgi:hypothetical protein
MFKKRLLIFTAAGAVTLATALSGAQDSQANRADGRSGDQTSQTANPANEHSHHRHHASFDPARRTAELTAQLNLTPDQQTKVQSALQSEDPQIQRALQDSSIARENCRTKMRDIRAATDSQIREMLDSNQQKQWDEMQTRRGERTQHRGSAAPDSNSIQQQPAR